MQKEKQLSHCEDSESNFFAEFQIFYLNFATLYITIVLIAINCTSILSPEIDGLVAHQRTRVQ
jgi:hypothetical protein